VCGRFFVLPLRRLDVFLLAQRLNDLTATNAMVRVFRKHYMDFQMPWFVSSLNTKWISILNKLFFAHKIFSIKKNQVNYRQENVAGNVS